MNFPDAKALYDVCDATWPAAHRWPHKGWMLRNGAGGGKRVSAATRIDPNASVPAAEDAMREIGQSPLFMIRDGEDDLDKTLADLGYAIVDPVVMYCAPTDLLTTRPIPRVTTFCIWEPLAIMREIWAQGGIGPNRIEVMRRACVKTGVLARWNEKPAGTAFAAISQDTCMVHAVEVLPHQRKQGVGAWLMRAAAFWAQEQGAPYLSVLCTVENEGANRLYSGLGFTKVGHYHYRQKPD